jgi:flagellar basal-body rod protein FlgG
MIENSNVSVGDEMVTMMTALRQSEGGARLVQVYDDLLGRALSTLGQSGK